jgi:hypothetical protein
MKRDNCFMMLLFKDTCLVFGYKQRVVKEAEFIYYYTPLGRKFQLPSSSVFILWKKYIHTHTHTHTLSLSLSHTHSHTQDLMFSRQALVFFSVWVSCFCQGWPLTVILLSASWVAGIIGMNNHIQSSSNCLLSSSNCFLF